MVLQRPKTPEFGVGNESPKPLAASEFDLFDQSNIASLIKPSEFAIRSLGLRDKNYHRRLAWIWAWNGTRRTYEYSENDLSAFSQAIDGFEVLAIHGDDPRRLLKIVRQAREILPGKAIIVICSSSASTSAANYLNAGADDVLSLDMSSAEAAARLRAHVRRRNSTIKKK